MFPEEYIYELAETIRKMTNIFAFVKVSAVDPDTARVKVVFADGAESGFLPVLSPRSSAGDIAVWLPDIDEQGAVLSAGDMNRGVFLGTVPKTADAPKKKSDYKKFSDGTEIQYDKATHCYSIKIGKDSKGNVSISAPNGKVDITVTDGTATINAKDIIFTGATTVTGNLTITGDVKAASVAAGSYTGNAEGVDPTFKRLNVIDEITVKGVHLSKHVHKYTLNGSPADTTLPSEVVGT